MFAVSLQPRALSPTVMKFADRWLYDLTSFHSFWKRLVQNQSDLFEGESVWTALLNSYGLHLFSPLQELKAFAQDFHRHYPGLKNAERRSSDSAIDKTFEVFSHLGLKKIEQLKRFSRAELQKRFGLSWAIFFEGIFNPLSVWAWKPYGTPEILSSTFEFEDFCVDAKRLLTEIAQRLDHLRQERPYFCMREMSVHFLLSQGNEMLKPSENEIRLSFTYEPVLEKDVGWILKLIEERLSQFQFDYPIWKFSLNLFPAGPKRQMQLSLFQNISDAIAWSDLCLKLKDQNFSAFSPSPTFSYLPETSWKRDSSPAVSSFHMHGLYRPLIQEDPRQISPPESALKFTERLTWFDEVGKKHQRDYFIARGQRAWIWIFKNEKDEWFKQGVVE